MLTREQIEEALNSDNKYPFQNTDHVDHKIMSLNIVRNKIPYEACKNILIDVEHDMIYFGQIDVVMEYLDESDLAILADCNCGFDENNECLYMFV